MSDYWASVLRSRLSRRRALVTSGTAGAGALFLAACGGGGKDSDPEQHSKLLSPVIDESKNARRGGVYKNLALRDPGGVFEPHTSGTGAISIVAYTYSALFYIKPGYMGPTQGEIEGDVVESWEMSPDKLTLTLKINPNAHFSPQPPVNGRSVDAHDVQASWERVATISSRRGQYRNDLNPSAPIVSLTSTDDRTVVIKLKEPYSTIYSLLCGNFVGDVFIGPKEAADPKVLDLRNTARGTGPWYLSDHTPSVGFTMKRNPGFKQAKNDVPYIEQIDWPVVLEYAAAMAQFRTGAAYSYPVRQEEILQTKREIPELTLMKSDVNLTSYRTYFGQAPTSNFRDERVRQAWMLTQDRDLFLDVYSNVSKFRDEGVQVETFYEAAVQCDTWRGWYLDPRDKSFGPNAKYFRKDLAEGKKLMAAAGYTAALPVNVYHPAQGADFGNPQFAQAVDVTLGMVEDSGLFKTRREPKRYQTEFLSGYIAHPVHAKFDDVALMIGNLQGDPVTVAYTYYHPQGQFGGGTDSTIENLLVQALREFDVKKRQDLVLELQRYEGGKQYTPRLASASGFQLFWPVLRNVNTFQGGNGRNYTDIFLDPDKPPLKKA
jgi:ABC-type transport system substrate-binding protein